MIDVGEAFVFLWILAWSTFVFLLFVAIMSVLQVFWKRGWGNHDQ